MKVKFGNVHQFGVIFATLLALVCGVFVYGASASTAQLTIFTDQPETRCQATGRNAPAVFQGGRFQLKFTQFWDEVVEVDITFPDGRVFTVPASYLLDGVIDQPLNDPVESREIANVAGEVSAFLPVPGEWPYGCYTFTGRGLASQKVARANMVVVPGGQPGANPGNAVMNVTRTGSNERFGQQGTFVDINGRGFLGDEIISLWATAPDGTVLSITDIDPNSATQAIADNSGDFQHFFQFGAALPTGTYQFTALGTLSRFRVISSFTLNSQPTGARGWAKLRVAFPVDRSDPQRSGFEVQGEVFGPGERVDLWVTFPDNSVRGLPSQFADDVGDFYAVLYLDETLPVGTYSVTAKGDTSKHLVVTQLTLEQTNYTEVNPEIVPEIIESSSDQTGEGIPPSP
jgi:hypothetical protein